MSQVSISERDGVAVLAVDRPPANAMDLGLLGELVEAVDRVAADVPPALVLAGREGFFSAGADLKAVPGYGPAEQRAMVEGINRMALGVYALPCPVVCAITGHAIAGGMVLALCGDHRVASTRGSLRPDRGQGRRALPAGGDRRRARRAGAAGGAGARPGQPPGRRGGVRAAGRLRRGGRAGRGARSRARRGQRAGGDAGRRSTPAPRPSCGAPRSRRSVSAPSAIRSWTHG